MLFALAAISTLTIGFTIFGVISEQKKVNTPEPVNDNNPSRGNERVEDMAKVPTPKQERTETKSQVITIPIVNNKKEMDKENKAQRRI